MGFTYQEKSGKTRKHATPDPVLRKGQKKESGERKPWIFAVSRQNNSWGYGDHIDNCLIFRIIIDNGKLIISMWRDHAEVESLIFYKMEISSPFAQMTSRFLDKLPPHMAMLL
jgi:hypothetical protein